jgi:methionyl-tRNA formyltransferase
MKRPETQELLAQYKPDLVVVAAYGRILPKALLDTPRLGCINVHASLLPKYRGASPIAHAIMDGETESGVCIMQMDVGLDTGDVHHCVSMPIGEDDTCGTMTTKLAALGARALIEALPSILDGSSQRTQQDDDASTYAPLLAKEDGALDFQLSATALGRRIRGLNPWPGCYAFKGEQRVQVQKAHVVDAQGTPGEVVRASGKGIVIACGEQALCLDEVKPAGKKAMQAAAWVAGRGVTVGDRFSREAE